MELYYKSVGRGASFLLNVPPDRRGLIHEADVASLSTFGKRMEATFEVNLIKGLKLKAANVRKNLKQFSEAQLIDGRSDTYWATDDGVLNSELSVDGTRNITFNVIRLRECIALGQRIEAFGIDTWVDGKWQEIAAGTSVGSCRIVRLAAPLSACTLRLRIVRSSAPIALSELGFYLEQG